jgi:MFS transporter, ACS family, allantoate permease
MSYYGMLFSLLILNIRLRGVLKGLGHATHAPLAPWRLIFLLIGMISCFCGILLVCAPVTPNSITLIIRQFFFLPDSPTSVKWLNEREKAIAVQRVAEGQTGVKNSTYPRRSYFHDLFAYQTACSTGTFKWDQAKEALRDYRVWLIVLSMFFSQAAGNVTTNFLGIIIKVSIQL